MSVNWTINRNSSDHAPVSDDLRPEAGTVKFAAGQVSAVIPINIVADDQPEEAEPFVLKLLPNTVTGNAEVNEPMEVRMEDLLSYPARTYIFVVLCSYSGLVTAGEKSALVMEYVFQMLCMCYARVCVCLCVTYCEVQWQTWHIFQKPTPLYHFAPWVFL